MYLTVHETMKNILRHFQHFIWKNTYKKGHIQDKKLKKKENLG